MATLLRLSGVKARIVAGFQGGTFNDWGDYYIIKSKDAHSWVEYFTSERGWVRVDPVEVVAPERISLGADRFFEQKNLAPILTLGIFERGSWAFSAWRQIIASFDALDFKVTQLLLDFDLASQREWLSLLGLDGIGYLWVAVILTTFIGIGFFYWRTSRRLKGHDELGDLFQKARRLLAERGFATEPWEAPATILNRLRRDQQNLAQKWEAWLTNWQQLRYAKADEVAWRTKKLKLELRKMK
jgi:hypothetical protein